MYQTWFNQKMLINFIRGSFTLEERLTSCFSDLNAVTVLTLKPTTDLLVWLNPNKIKTGGQSYSDNGFICRKTILELAFNDVPASRWFD